MYRYYNYTKECNASTKMFISAYHIVALGKIQCTLAVNCPADLQLSCPRGRTLPLLIELTDPESRVAIFSTYQITKLLFHISSSYSGIMLATTAWVPIIPETMPA